MHVNHVLTHKQFQVLSIIVIVIVQHKAIQILILLGLGILQLVKV